MNFGERIYRSLSGGLSSATEVGDLSRALAAIVRVAGGPTAAARLIGVHPATLRRWRAGTTAPSARNAPRLLRVVRRARLTEARERRIRRGTVRLAVQHRDSGRERDIDGRSLNIDPAIGDYLCDAFLSGASPEELREAFKAAIQDPFYGSWIDADDDDIEDPDTYGLNVVTVGW